MMTDLRMIPRMNLKPADEEFEPDGTQDEYDNIDISDYVSDHDDDVADYKLRDDNYPDAEDKQTIPHKLETSFYELLLDQLGMLKLDDRTRKIAEQIVGSIDDDGYLRRETASIVDDLAFRQNIESTDSEVEYIISRIQQFDPAGCGRPKSAGMPAVTAGKEKIRREKRCTGHQCAFRIF